MMAVLLALGLLGSVGLIWHVHGDPDHLQALGPWAHRLEAAALISAAVQAWALIRRIRGGAIAERPARLAFSILALAWLSMMTHPWAQGAVYYTLVIALGLYAALVSTRRRLPALELIAFNLGLLFVGAELSLRALGLFVHSPLLQIASSDASEWLAANRLPPGQLRWGFPINSRGYYDDELVKKPAGGCLVTAIGDSFTLGI